MKGDGKEREGREVEEFKKRRIYKEAKEGGRKREEERPEKGKRGYVKGEGKEGMWRTGREERMKEDEEIKTNDRGQKNIGYRYKYE